MGLNAVEILAELGDEVTIFDVRRLELGSGLQYVPLIQRLMKLGLLRETD